jgi:hypothetical protein
MDVVLLVPAVLAATLAVAPGCSITDATLTWGFKDSFRAYIDGGIANGEWTTDGGASYQTPVFTWAGGTGSYDPTTGVAEIDFAGSVRFTGHGGVLDTTIADPSVRLDGATGALLLDVSGPTMDGTPTDLQDVEFVALPSVDVVGDDAVRTVEAPTELTEDGATAFPNYPAGEAFDPVSISMTVGKDCAVLTSDAPAAEDGPDFWPLVAGLSGLGALAALAGGVGVFVATRRRDARA